MKNLELDYVLSDKFLMEVQKEIKNIHPDAPFTCMSNCPLRRTQYVGICISWMNKVLGVRNVVYPYKKYMPSNCMDLFNYVFEHALIDVNKKQNKI